jgi:TolB-like protein/Tfp pilus assembly protein PilF
VSLFQELKRRNVFRVGVAYLVASWVLLQVLDVSTSLLDLPAWAPRLVFVILAIGLIPALVFAWAFEMTPEGLKKEAEVDRTQSIAGQTGRKLNYAITGFLVVALALLLIERQLQPSVAPEAVATTANADQAPERDRSIAVLPFVNMSSDAEQEYFSDGITEEILNSLASVKELKVAGRTSSFAFKGQNDDLRRIGDSLGVQHILEGSVRKAGDKVRITAQLIQVQDGFHLWSETYDRELTDVFAIQDEIAKEILTQLKAKLLSNTGDVLTASMRTSPEVYELYLRAKQRIYTRNRDEIARAIVELDEAIRLDAQYAPAFAQRAIATMLSSDQQYGNIPHQESRRRGKRYADEALRLGPNSAEAWAAMGLYYDRDHEAAVDALVKALTINPNLIDASNWLQIALRNTGQMRSSLEILKEIAERDPLYRPAFSNAMQLFHAFGMTDEAEQLIKRIEAFNPDNPDLHLARATSYLYAGETGKGLQQIEEAAKRGPLSGVGQLFLSIGLMNTGQFERALNEGSIYWRPDALYFFGRKDEAIALAREHADGGDPDSLFYMLVIENREKELVDYLEERWPSLAAFAAENPGNDNGYDLMINVAIAYRRTGNDARADEALELFDRRITQVEKEGVDNFLLDTSKASYLAMQGDIDGALALLKSAVDEGLSASVDPLKIYPEFEILEGDPRFDEIKAGMLDNLNYNRRILELPPFTENYQVAR